MRKPLVIANWKMNGSRLQLAELVSGLRAGFSPWLAVQDAARKETVMDVVLCPSFLYIPQLAEQLAGSPVFLGAQDIAADEPGAHTGDVAGEMLKDFGCRYVLIGHSERRQAHGETDALVVRKVQRALACGLLPVLCVGETLAEREQGLALERVAAQLDSVVSAIPTDTRLVIAYEPVWAIGTGKTASAAQAQEVHAFIRERLGSAGSQTRLLYGGSVNAGNAKELFSQADIDGGLIGGASLQAKALVDICRAAVTLAGATDR